MTNQPTDKRDELRHALIGMLDHYTCLVNSGDAGFWDPEDEEVVKTARAALATPPEQPEELSDAAEPSEALIADHIADVGKMVRCPKCGAAPAVDCKRSEQYAGQPHRSRLATPPPEQPEGRSDVVEQWSLTWHGSPPAVFVRSGIAGLPDSRRDVAYLEFADKKARTAAASALAALVDEHNATVSALATPPEQPEGRSDEYLAELRRQVKVPAGLKPIGQPADYRDDAQAGDVVEKLRTLRNLCDASHQPFYVEILDEVLAALPAQPCDKLVETLEKLRALRVMCESCGQSFYVATIDEVLTSIGERA